MKKHGMERLAKAAAVGVVLWAALSGAAMAQTLKIGVVAPLTGPGASWGLAAKWAAEIQAAEVNADGGLAVGGTKYKVNVIAYDDQYKAAEAVAAYNRLVNQDGVKFMVIATSPSTMALRNNLEQDKIVALTSAYTPAVIDANTKYLFRQYSIAADFLPSYVDWMSSNFKERQMVTLNPNDETGWGHAKVTLQAYKDKGFNVVGSELYERSVKDFQSLLTKVLGLKPDVVDLGSSAPASAGLIVRQARELGYKGRFVQTGGPGWAAVVDAAGKEAAEGMVNMLYADPSNKGYQRVVAQYKKAVGQAPNEMIVCYYDGLSVLLRAIQKAGTTTDTAKVAASFASALPMKSLQGDEMTYASQQIRTWDYVGVMRNGEPVVSGKVR
jgi:branched-chain amino acid transport system substrate-binding protein